MSRNRQISISSQRVRALLRVLFVVFSFLYFYKFQTPLLALVQHHLSEGQTTYAPLISSIVLTFVLFVVQRLVSRWVNFSESTYFFSYVPSAILAVLLTAFTPAVNTNILIGVGVALFCFVCAVVCSCMDKTVDNHSTASFFKLFWVHSVGMLGIFLFIGGLSHSNDVLTYELKIARSLNAQENDCVLHIGESSLQTSNRLVALRAYALSQRDGRLGDSLFVYPLKGTGAVQLMFAPNDTLAQLLPPDSLYSKLGSWPSEKESAIGYFERMKNRSSHVMAKDYWLTALLLDKKLDTFVKELPNYYVVADSVDLPHHYKEALSLYNAETASHLSFYEDSITSADYQSFMGKGAEYEDVVVRKNKMYRKYGHTYWWYYYYQD